MIEIPTCLVLGAGASAPYGFPVGEKLMKDIIERVAKPNDKLWKALIRSGQDRGHLEDFVSSFRESGQESIDAFLAHRPSFLEVGKAAIAATLIPYEKGGDALFRPPADHWYGYVWSHLQDTGAAEFGENKLTVVTFNYDRSLERFLITAFAKSFAVDLDEATETVSAAIPIVHVHGQMGALSESAVADGTRPYNVNIDPEALRIAASGIIVLSEADDTSPEFERAAKMVSEARNVVFLGCRYHEPNMRRLQMPKHEPGQKVDPFLLGSGYEMKDGEMDVVRRKWGIQVLARRNLDFLRETVALQPDLYGGKHGLHPAIPWPPSGPYGVYGKGQ